MTTKTTKQGTDKTVNAVEDVVAAGQEAMQSFMKAGAENYEKAFGSARVKEGEERLTPHGRALSRHVLN